MVLAADSGLSFCIATSPGTVPVFPLVCGSEEECAVTRTASLTERPESIASVVRRLAAAQKPAARSAPAYSRFVNRRVGRVLAAMSFRAGLGPNAVTAVSAIFTFSAVALLVALPPSWPLGCAIALLLLVGYAFDSADGQVARLTGRSSLAGEWLDHVVDSLKASAIPLALAVGFYRFEVLPVEWLLVPIVGAIVSAVLFFAMILTEQLRARSARPERDSMPGAAGWLRSIFVAPMDYGVLCLSFVLLGAPVLFAAVYTTIVVATAVFLLLAGVKWFRELSGLERAEVRS